MTEFLLDVLLVQLIIAAWRGLRLIPRPRRLYLTDDEVQRLYTAEQLREHASHRN